MDTNFASLSKRFSFPPNTCTTKISSRARGDSSVPRKLRGKTFATSCVATLIFLVQMLALLPTEASAQCPDLSAEGFTFGSTNFNTAKSQMWYNDGLWWGVFSDDITGIHIYSFPNNAATQGPIIDANILAIPDALWDGTNLYVMVWKSVSLATFYKFSYNSGTKVYTLVQAPTAIPLNGSSTSALVMAKDSTGKIWATFTGTQGGLSDGMVHVIWTTSADHATWNTTGTTIASGLATNIQEISNIVHFGGNKIGVVWSNQPGKEIAFRYHTDGDVETTWSTKEVIDSGNGPRGLGGVADDHLAIKAAPDGRVYLVAKDNDNDGTPTHATEGRVWLYVRTAAGAWGQKTIVQPDFSQLPTRPSLILDISANNVYVIYHDESPSGAGRNFIARSSMDNPFFDFPCVLNQSSSSNPTTTKQNVTSSMGLMVAASTGNTGSGEIVFRTVTLLPATNPVPTITPPLVPSSGSVGGSAFTLTVNGTNYINSSVVRWNGSDRTTTFVSSTQLTASISAADIAFASTANITVFNPAPGGGESNVANFPVNNPVPVLSSINPNTKTAGNPAFTLTVFGSGFVSSSTVRFSGSNRTTSFINSTQLTAQITAADIQTAGQFPITVSNPGPGGGVSNAINLTVNNPVPVITTISPTQKNRGDAAFTLTVNGTNFVNGSVVQFGGSPRTTTFFSSTQLTAQITAADVSTAGVYPITVFNAAPGGGTSNAVNLTVNNPVPTIANISPTSKTAGDPAFTLTVNGTNYINGSVVNWNGSPRTTSFVNATQVTAQILASDIASAGSANVTVVNAGPGGGTSNGVSFTISPAGGGCVGYESDVAPRPNGNNNGSITISDWVQSGRFSAGLDIPAPGCEFQRADSAGRTTLGNGGITVSDWVQAGRYAAGLDPVTPVGGPTGLAPVEQGPVHLIADDAAAADRIVRAVGTQLTAGQATSVAIDLEAQGDENAIGFTVTFDPTVLTYVSAAAGTGTSGATLNFNASQVASGRLGVAIAQPAGSTFTAGVKQLAVINFTVAGNASGSTAIGFGDQPIFREIVDPNVNELLATFTGATLNITSVGNPVPVISDLSPASATALGAAFTLTVNGSNFVSGSVVKWNDVAKPTTFVNAGQLTAQISAADILTAGNVGVTVFNDGPGGGLSNSVTFAVNNPAPTASGLSPSSATAGGPAFSLTVNGSNFVSGSIVRWNGVDRTTTFVNATQLTAQITAADIQSSGSASVTVFNPGPGGGTSSALSFSISQPAPQIEFSSASYDVSEGGGGASVTVIRTGDASAAVAVDFSIVGAGNYVACDQMNGQAVQNCDYTVTAGILSFDAGETSKTFTVPIVEDVYVEGMEAFTVALANPTEANLGPMTNATVHINDNDSVSPSGNIIDQTGTYVRQQYLDFLNREPDSGGLAYWSDQIDSCGTDLACIHSRRIGVSGAFFVELEFQRTGSIVYRMYKAAYSQRPTYEQFMPDRSQLVDGPQLPATTLDFANRFVLRPEFKNVYPDSMSASQFVNKLYDSALLMNNDAQRQQAIADLGNGKTRAQVLLDLIDITEFKDREYNPSFVLMEYFGYLRRDPDQGGYDFWLDVLNNREPNNYRSMICAFLTSAEYQQRFSSVVTRSNADCAQQ